MKAEHCEGRGSHLLETTNGSEVRLKTKLPKISHPVTYFQMRCSLAPEPEELSAQQLAARLLAL